MDYKKKIHEILRNRDFDNLLDLFDINPNAVRKHLTMASYDADDAIRQSAVLSFAFLSQKRGNLKPQYFKEIIRRHIWGMNEEGANIDWSAPEIIGAVISGQPSLFGEFAPTMIAAALEEPIFHKGMFTAIRMIGIENKQLIECHLPVLKEFVYCKDVELAKLAREALSFIPFSIFLSIINDPGSIMT